VWIDIVDSISLLVVSRSSGKAYVLSAIVENLLRSYRASVAPGR
jgi:hypothetical protein